MICLPFVWSEYYANMYQQVRATTGSHWFQRALTGSNRFSLVPTGAHWFHLTVCRPTLGHIARFSVRSDPYTYSFPPKTTLKRYSPSFFTRSLSLLFTTCIILQSISIQTQYQQSSFGSLISSPSFKSTNLEWLVQRFNAIDLYHGAAISNCIH